jgi:predicted aspartyl protease
MNPRILAAVIAALALGACSGPPSGEQIMMSLIAPAPKVTVLSQPVGWTNYDLFDDTRIFLQGRINGQDTPVMLDSGAAMTTVDAGLASQLNLKPGLSAPVKGAVGNVGGKMMKGVTLEVAGVRLENMTVLVIDLSAVSRQVGRPMPVILGREVFEPLIADLDLPNRRLAFRARDGWAAPPAAIRIPLARSGDGQRRFPISLEGRAPVEAHFDLGNGGALFLRPAYWKGLGLLEGRRNSMTLMGGVGGLKPAPILTAREVTLGGVVVRDVPTVLSPGDGKDPAVANVGYAILSRFHLLVDYKGGSLFLLPAADAADRPFRRNRSGLFVTPGDGRQQVMLVAPGSPAEAAGWKVGDEIVAVDGTPFGPNVGASPLNRWSMGPAGETRTLTLGDGSTRRLTLADYY